MELSYITGTGLTKLSILFFVVRITRRSTNRWVFYVVWCTIVFCSLTTVIYFILPLAECHPFSAFWQQVDYQYILSDAKYKCLDEGARVVSAGTFSVLQDFMVASLPLSTVWGLQMPTRQKIMVSAIFGGGYLTCIFGVLRLIYSYDAFFVTYDVTWEAPHLFLWTNLELQGALICASIPALKIFVKHVKQSSIRSKLSLSMGRYPGDTSRSRISQGGPKSPGFYTQQLSGDTNYDDNVTGDGFIKVHDTIEVTSEHVSSLKGPSLDKGPV